MKQEFFERYSDNEIRSIRSKLIDSYGKIDESLPDAIKTFVKGENAQVGNHHTRVTRCISLIDRDCIRRFINQ